MAVLKAKTIWMLLFLVINTEAAVFVGNPLAFARPCKDNEVIIARWESNQPPGEENKYILGVPADIIPSSQLVLKFDSDATVTLEHGNTRAPNVKSMWVRFMQRSYSGLHFQYNNSNPNLIASWMDCTYLHKLLLFYFPRNSTASVPDEARIYSYPNTGVFNVRYFKKSDSFVATVKGPPSGAIPYPTSIILNGDELCPKPNIGFFDNVIEGVVDTAELSASVPDSSCGRKRVVHTELIVNGEPTKPGDWPWHAALFKVEGLQTRYICGGTLISKTIVLTAAHCTTTRGNPVTPKSLNVFLGKHSIFGGDIGSQEKDVFEVIVNPAFDAKTVKNDISLLRLGSEVTYTDYVQPACLWSLNDYKKIPSGDVYGTVVGWGINNQDEYSIVLEQTSIPKVTEAQCIKSNPVFFAKKLDSAFCAGFNNGKKITVRF